jgi:hypothetical protein
MYSTLLPLWDRVASQKSIISPELWTRSLPFLDLKEKEWYCIWTLHVAHACADPGLLNLWVVVTEERFLGCNLDKIILHN